MKASDFFVRCLENEGIRFSIEDMTEIRLMVVQKP